MNYLKKFVVALKKMGIKINPGVVLMIILAVTLAVVLWRWWSARRKSSAEPITGTPDAAGRRPSGPPPVPKDRFVQVWRRFVSELPPMVRRSIHQFQPVLVLGGLGTGKTSLITRHTDWQRQARYLLGSQLDDPDLQIYLGSRVLVLELPPSVLAGSGRGLREALLALFGGLFRRRTPIVVVALNPLDFEQMTPDEARALADAVRGKINLLSLVRRKPIEVRLAITHMDRIPGFSDMAEVVRRQGGSLELQIHEGVPVEALDTVLPQELGKLAQVRSTSLLSLSAERYLKAVGFLRESPKLLAPVARFASALLAPEPLSRQPWLSSVYLTSAQLDDAASAPFQARELTDDRLRNPLMRHRVAAAAIALVLCAGLGWAYVRERVMWVHAASALNRYSAETGLRQKPELESTLRKQVMDFVRRRAFPSFFGAAERKAARVVAERLRRDFVLNSLRDALAHPHGVRRAVYLSALADLKRDSRLVMLIRNRDARSRWSHSTGLQEAMIVDYVDVVDAVDSETPPTPPLASKVWLSAERHRAASVETLYDFARDVRRALEKDRVDHRSLPDIRAQAGLLRGVVSDVTGSPDVSEILRVRSEEDPDQADVAARLSDHLVELQAPALLGMADRRAELGLLLDLVESTRISKPPRAPRRYLDVCEWVSMTLGTDRPRMAGAQSRRDPRKVEVAIEGRLLRGADWMRLTRDHTVVEVVQNYLQRPSREQAVFFIPGVEYPSLVMNPDTRGAFLFSGTARIPGRFTRTALMSGVAPALGCHARIMPVLARIDPAVAKELDALVNREVEQYSEMYARSLQNFYGAFDIRTKGAAGNLRVVLDRMLSGTSPLTRHLSLVGDNARLDKLEPAVRARLDSLIGRLEPFQGLHKAVTSTASGESAYQSYLLLLRQTRESLQASKPAPSATDSASPTSDSLRERLSPVGKMALDIATCSPDSKDLAVRQWLKDVSLGGELRHPFLVPVEQVYEVGRREVEDVMREVWRYDLRRALDPLLLRFPFNLGSPDDATPEQVASVLHPTTGALVDLRRRLVDPLFVRPVGCDALYRPIGLPEQMTPLLKWASRVAGLLWDEGGQPKAISVAVTPVPFDSQVSDNRKQPVNAHMTVSFISAGSTTLVNFNQRPFPVGLLEPWMTAHTAQVGIKLTDLGSQDEIYPDPLVETSHWALLRLLYRAERRGRRFRWPVRFGIRGRDGRSSRVEVPVSFEVHKDPFEAFSLDVQDGRISDDEGFGGPRYRGGQASHSLLGERPR